MELTPKDFAQQAQNLYGKDPLASQHASDFYYQILDVPNILSIILQVLRRYFDLYSNYAALAVVSHFVHNQWNDLDQETQIRLQKVLFSMVEMPRARHPKIKEYRPDFCF